MPIPERLANAIKHWAELRDESQKDAKRPSWNKELLALIDELRSIALTDEQAIKMRESTLAQIYDLQRKPVEAKTVEAKPVEPIYGILPGEFTPPEKARQPTDVVVLPRKILELELVVNDLRDRAIIKQSDSIINELDQHLITLRTLDRDCHRALTNAPEHIQIELLKGLESIKSMINQIFKQKELLKSIQELAPLELNAWCMRPTPSKTRQEVDRKQVKLDTILNALENDPALSLFKATPAHSFLSGLKDKLAKLAESISPRERYHQAPTKPVHKD